MLNALATAQRLGVRLRPGPLLAVWTVPGVLQASQLWISNTIDGRAPSWWRIGIVEMPGWYLWAALTPLIFTMADRFPLRRGMAVRNGAAHIACWIGCSAAQTAVIATTTRLFGAMTSATLFAAYVGPGRAFLVYGATVGVAHWMLATQRERQYERVQAALSIQLATAELNALRTQLHPHFLFNTLNTIAVLIRERDTSVAVALVTQLGDILRHVLRTSKTQETALAQEIAFVRAYLEIEQYRFGDRLSVRWRVPDALMQAAVPVFVLQPLVENAVRHGIARTDDGGALEIGASLDGGVLTLWVADNGPGPAPAGETALERGHGVGLANTRSRLAHLYPRRASVALLRGADGGARAQVQLPFRQWSETESHRQPGLG